jgi:hypothetical protein
VSPAKSLGALQAAEKRLMGGKKCQGTTLVVPQQPKISAGLFSPGGMLFRNFADPSQFFRNL